MNSIREQILTGILNALLNNTNAASNVFRERSAPIEREVSPAIVVVPESEADNLFTDWINESVLTVNIEIYTRGDYPNQIADPIAIAAHNIIMMNAGLRGLCFQIKKSGSKWEAHEADQEAGVLTTSYTFGYLHPIADITSKQVI